MNYMKNNEYDLDDFKNANLSIFNYQEAAIQLLNRKTIEIGSVFSNLKSVSNSENFHYK